MRIKIIVIRKKMFMMMLFLNQMIHVIILLKLLHYINLFIQLKENLKFIKMILWKFMVNIVNISHKLNEILKYQEDTNQTTSVNFNGDNNSRLRNLAERKQLNIIKGDYLLIIYGFNNTVSPKLYYAYAILNNLSKQKDESKEINYLGGVENITLLNEV